MYKPFFRFIISTAALLMGPLFLQAAALQVQSAAPKGSLTEQGRQAVSVTFNQPVVALSEQAEFATENCPLVITPAVKGSCRFTGTQTVLFEPAENWPEASRFTVKIAEGFSSRVSGEKLAAPYTFSFSTVRPVVRGTLPRNNEHWLSLQPTLYVRFSLPMSPARAASAAYLQHENGQKIPLSARFVTEEEFDKDFSYADSAQHVLAFTPRQSLQKNTAYTLVLPAGLRAASGTLGLAQTYQLAFSTYPDLEVLGSRHNGCLPYTATLRLSSPVRLRNLLAAMKVSPKTALQRPEETDLDSLGWERIIPPLNTLQPQQRKEWLNRYDLTEQEQQKGTAFFEVELPFLTLQPGKSVTVTLDKNLQDIYGDRLGKDYTFTIENNGYCPAVDFSGGFGVLESYLPARLPVEIINLSSLPVRAARFNKENYIPFAEQSSRSCAPRKLDAPTYEGNYSFAIRKDQALRTYIDLKRFQPTAQDSIVFSQIQLPGKEENPENTGKGCWVSSTDNLTDVGLTFKTSAESILVWATSLETGLPLANLAVELRDKSNTILWSGSTDMNGLARAPGWSRLEMAEMPRWGNPVLYAFVSSAGGDGVISTQLDDGLEPWRFNVPFTYSPQREQLLTHLFTERGIYRPGEKVYLKGVVRRRGANGWTIPQDMHGEIKVYDATDNQILTQPVTVSKDMGTFDVSFDLPASAHTGSWQIAFTPQVKEQDPSSSYTYFNVETAKEASFKIALQAEKSDFVAGETARFHAAVNYQFGAPVAQAPAQWTLRREMTWFHPKGFDGYTFIPYFLRENEYKEDGSLLASTHGKTDDKGTSSFEAVLPQTVGPVRAFAELGVQSPARQDLFSRTVVTVHPASFYLGAKVVNPDSAKAGSPLTAQVIAVTTDGKPTSASVTAQIRRRDWHSVRKVGLSGRLEWVSEKEEIELPSQTLEVSEEGGTFSFIPPQSGNYYITLISSDVAGRRVLGGFDVTVYGKDGAPWKQSDDDILPLKQDKNVYLPGQKARIHVQSPYETATALVTVEREGILDAWTTTLKGGADYIEVPIKATYLPNVYVSVVAVKGRSAAPVSDEGVDLGKPQGKVGYVNLEVAPVSKKIEVSLQTAKTDYRPGEEVTVKVQTKLAKKGVPAEVALFVVDEGMLALSNYKTPDLFAAFYGNVPLGVMTADNRSYVIGQRNFGEKGENRGGGGSADAKLGGTDLRSRFLSVPYYSARVQTNAKGRGEVSFKLPDNLTRFRIMAVAVRPQEFGSAQTEIKVSKPLMVLANLPAIARKADQFSCSALVYNYEDKKGKVEVSAHAQGSVRLVEQTSQTVSVPLGQAQEVSWPCRAVENGPAQVTFSVKGSRSSDAMRTEIQVVPVEQKQTLSLVGSTQTSQEELVDKPGQLATGAENQVIISLSSTALLNLKGSLVYLMTYPYDCLEQQFSKIMPVIAGAPLVEAFKLGDMTQLKQRAQEILDNQTAYQHSSGGFGYWKDSRPDPYLTAYVLEVNYWARQAGFTVPEQALERAVAWLEAAFNKNQRHAFTYSSYETQTARAYSVYVLALYNKSVMPAFNNLYAARVGMPVPAVAYLLKAAAVLKRPQALQQELSQQLLNRAVHTPSSVYFSVPAPMPWLHINDVTATALSLEALLEAKQPFADAFKTAAWLLKQLNAQGNWNSTSENAAVFRALNRYYHAQENVEPDFTARVSWNETAEGLTHLFRGRSVEEVRHSLDFDTVYAQDAEARFAFTKTGAGTLYYALSQEYTPRAYPTPVNAGFEVTRQLTTADGAPVTTLQAGQPYRVTLTVRTAAARHFVVVEDFIPGGLEIINTSLATASSQAKQEENNTSFHRVERYHDRVAAFADYLPAGTHTFSYLVSTVVPGEFAYPSAWASLMYEPAVFGRNATSHIKIQ